MLLYKFEKWGVYKLVLTLVAIALLTFGFKWKQKGKYYMVIVYEVNNLSAEWYEKSYADTISLDSGCISNKLTEFDLYQYNGKAVPTGYSVKMLKITKPYNSIDFAQYCPPERQLTEYTPEILLYLSKYSNYIDSNIIKVQKQVPLLDSSSQIFFTRSHKNNKRDDVFFRVFEVAANRKDIAIGYEWNKVYMYGWLNSMKHCSKKGSRDGDTAKIEIYTNVKILREIRCE